MLDEKLFKAVFKKLDKIFDLAEPITTEVYQDMEDSAFTIEDGFGSIEFDDKKTNAELERFNVAIEKLIVSSRNDIKEIEESSLKEIKEIEESSLKEIKEIEESSSKEIKGIQENSSVAKKSVFSDFNSSLKEMVSELETEVFEDFDRTEDEVESFIDEVKKSIQEFKKLNDKFIKGLDSIKSGVSDTDVRKALVFVSAHKSEYKELSSLRSVPQYKDIESLIEEIKKVRISFIEKLANIQQNINSELSKILETSKEKVIKEISLLNVNSNNNLFPEKEINEKVASIEKMMRELTEAIGHEIVSLSKKYEELSGAAKIEEDLNNKLIKLQVSLHDCLNWVAVFSEIEDEKIDTDSDSFKELQSGHKYYYESLSNKSSILTERYLTHHFNSPAYPYLSSGKYKNKEKLVEAKKKTGKEENYNSAAIQWWYYHNPAYPYQSPCKYKTKKEIKKAVEGKKNVLEIIQVLGV